MNSICLNNCLFRVSYVKAILERANMSKMLVPSTNVLTVQRGYLHMKWQIKFQKTGWGCIFQWEWKTNGRWKFRTLVSHSWVWSNPEYYSDHLTSNVNNVIQEFGIPVCFGRKGTTSEVEFLVQIVAPPQICWAILKLLWPLLSSDVK